MASTSSQSLLFEEVTSKGRRLLHDLQHIRDVRFRSDRHFELYKSSVRSVHNYVSQMDMDIARNTAKEIQLWSFTDRLKNCCARDFELLENEDDEWMTYIECKLQNLGSILFSLRPFEQFALRALDWLQREISHYVDEIKKREEGVDIPTLNISLSTSQRLRSCVHRA